MMFTSYTIIGWISPLLPAGRTLERAASGRPEAGQRPSARDPVEHRVVLPRAPRRRGPAAPRRRAISWSSISDTRVGSRSRRTGRAARRPPRGDQVRTRRSGAAWKQPDLLVGADSRRSQPRSRGQLADPQGPGTAAACRSRDPFRNDGSRMNLMFTSYSIIGRYSRPEPPIERASVSTDSQPAPSVPRTNAAASARQIRRARAPRCGCFAPAREPQRSPGRGCGHRALRARAGCAWRPSSA